MDYDAYLASPRWQTLRAKVLVRDEFRCTCGATDNLEVHHLTYERLGRERLADLVTLCRRCHAEIGGFSPPPPRDVEDLERFLQRQKAYRAIFLEAHGPFPHPCCFGCGEIVDGHTTPLDAGAAIVHHWDHDRMNNEPANLAAGHHGCHSGYHSRARWDARSEEEREAELARLRAMRKGTTLSAEHRAALHEGGARWWANLSDEERAEWAVTSKRRGRARAASLTKEERRRFARKGSDAALDRWRDLPEDERTTVIRDLQAANAKKYNRARRSADRRAEWDRMDPDARARRLAGLDANRSRGFGVLARASCVSCHREFGVNNIAKHVRRCTK